MTLTYLALLEIFLGRIEIMGNWLTKIKEKNPETHNLRTVKSVKSQKWNEHLASDLFTFAVERVKAKYPANAWPWATQECPALRQAVKDAEAHFNEAYRRQNVTACRQAAVEYERAFGILIEEFLKGA